MKWRTRPTFTLLICFSNFSGVPQTNCVRDCGMRFGKVESGALCYKLKKGANLFLPVSVSLSICLSSCLSVSLPACLSVCLPACLSACLPACLSVCLLFCLSVCFSSYVCLSVSVSRSLARSLCKTEYKIQTKKVKRHASLTGNTKHMHIFGVSPFFKRQNNS